MVCLDFMLKVRCLYFIVNFLWDAKFLYFLRHLKLLYLLWNFVGLDFMWNLVFCHIHFLIVLLKTAKVHKIIDVNLKG